VHSFSTRDRSYRRLFGVAILAIFALAVGCVTPAGRASVSMLEGRYWRLVELRGQPALPTPGAREAGLQFAADSMRVSGSGGCNRVSGPYTRDGQRLGFGALISTRMACADQRLTEQEGTFLSALSLVNRHEVTGDTLVLFHDNDRLVRLVAAPR
jgi:heat shock protein HslJ